MKTMRTMKGSAGALAFALAASFLLLLPGCQGPAGPQADRAGTVSLTIGQLDMGRAIQPDIELANFTGFSAVFERTAFSSVTVDFPQGQTTAQAEVPQGEWYLTVSAFIGSAVAATYGPRTVNVGPGFTGVNAVLTPIPAGGPGTFTWALTVPAGTAGELTVWSVGENGVIAGTIDIADYDGASFDGTPDPVLWEGNLQLAAGAYFVRFALEHDDYGVAALNSDLHVYQGMTSSVARIFTDAQFRDAVDDEIIESAAVSIAAPVTGATPAMTATVAGSAGFTAGAVTWEPASGAFRPSAVYAATVTLTANPGHVFANGVTATVNGQPATVTGAGATVTLEYTFPATELDPLIAAWDFTGNATVDVAIIGPANIMVQPSSGQQQDARLQFLALSEGIMTPRVLSGMSQGINVVNPAGGGGGLDGLANNAWWQTYISTAGRTDIAVTWRMRSTNTGPRDWQLQYRVGTGGGWNNVGGLIVLPSGNPAFTGISDKSRFLPQSAEGHDSLYLRWLMTSNVATNGSPIVYGGTHQINNIVIRSGEQPPDNGYDCENCSDAGCEECEPSVDVIRISAANSTARGQTVTVEGFVTNRTMNAAGTGLDGFNLFLQDGTGPRDGILVWGGPAPNINLVDFTNQWVRVTGTIAAGGGAASPRNQIQIGGNTPGVITIIDPPANAPTFDPQAVQLADIVAPNNDYWFMPISLGPVRFGHTNNRADFLAPGVNQSADPARSHFVIVDGGQRVELRPSFEMGAALDSFVTGEYIIITRAYVTWQNIRQAIQLLHAQVERYDP